MSVSTRDWRADLKVFRERMGGLSEEKKAWAKAQRQTLKAISDALKQGPMTIPQISAAAHLPSPDVIWHVMAMKRYGKIAEAGQSGDYYLYQLREEA
ncbi:MAG: winged helix-turn-helix domain-containing protein [Bryobacteraceae bacterium]|nr:winged helix-turn-helix domain-containing protein [Bryobacteraceae bacterium]